MPDTIRAAVARALEALDRLQSLGEDVEDEWTYVNDLGDAWRTRLEAVAEARGDEPLGDGHAEAVTRAIHEVEQITDPHRAIDWMSTFPQVVLLAIGEGP
jgi:hypothetical protein